MATNTTAVQAKAAKPVAAAGPWRDAFGRLLRNKLAVVGLILVSLLLFCGIFGPLIAPWPYQVQDLAAVQANGNRPLPPLSPGHLLGTDQLGRDLLSRLLDGARISITVAFVVQFVIICLGVPVGAIAGWFGGRTDNALMRLTDVIYAFPDILFIILLSVAFRDTVVGQSMDGLLLVFIAIGLVGWVTVARLTRGQMLALKETEFVEAARAIGVSDRKIVTRHLLPNGMGPIIVAITLGIPVAILAEATLAYIGIGVQPPRASWGSLISEGQKFIRAEPHLVVFPAIAIAL
ncbi:MAG: ABC transporter permease, partial [Chloroflexota bacterium]